VRDCDVAIIGGGIIGRSVAFELARRAVGAILLVDEGDLGGEPSPAAAGFLPVASMRSPRGILFDLARRSLEIYPDFLAQIAAASGTMIELEHPGCLQFPNAAETVDALRDRVRRRRELGFAAEEFSRRELDEIRGLNPRGTVAAYFPREAQVDARLLLEALQRGSERLGVYWIRGRAELVREGGRVEVAVGGRRVRAEHIVLAAGWWSAEIAKVLGFEIAVGPARGEMLEVEGEGVCPPHAIEHGVLILPRRPARAWIGGLVEFDAAPEPSVLGRRVLLERAAAIWPAVRQSVVRAHWAGVRPCSLVRHPVVDQIPGEPQLHVATGHHRSGFLLAPLTAKVVAARLLSEELPVEPRAVCWA